MKNRDIEIVEDALNSLKVAAEIKFKNAQAENANEEEMHLRDFLKHIPQAVFEKHESHCVAYVDGVKFCFFSNEYSELNYSWKIIYARYKRLRKFLWFKRVSVQVSCVEESTFSRDIVGLKWVLEEHLKALQFEQSQLK